MNAKTQSVARRTIAGAQSIPIFTSPAWKRRANRTALALATAAALLPLATQAAKPPKPPPNNAAFVPVNLGHTATDLNNAGQVVGSTSLPGYPDSYHYQACLLNPGDTDGNGVPDTWFADQNADGQNDLIIALGTLPGSTSTRASAINDLGLVVGSSTDTDAAFLVVPQGSSWYQDANGDGVNDLMIALGTLPGAAPGCAPRDLNLNNLGQVVGWFSEPGGICTGFLLNPVEVTPGVWQWFQDDGTGANALMLGLGNFAPSSINNLGQIIGTLADRATLRQPDGTLVDLGGGALPSWGEDINNAGQISLSFNIGSPGGRPGLLTPLDTNSDGTPDLWNRDLNGDGFNDLIVDVGGVKTLGIGVVVVHGLNDIGSVLGYSANDTGRLCTRRVAFLWENGVADTLTSLTGNAGEFRAPAAINNARQILSDGYVLLPTP